MSTEMAEACGVCYRSFLPGRKINESLKCACQRPFFSQTVARNNLPTDRDCWIEVPKRFVRHYSSLFGETVNFEGADGRLYCCSLVGSDIVIVGYGFEWYDFAISHDIRMGDQVVFTLMENSRFLVQVHRANPRTVPLAKVKVEQDFEIQVAGPQDWLQAKARKSGANITLKEEQDVDNLPGDGDTVPLEAQRSPELNDEIAGKILSWETTDEQSLQAEAQSEDDAKSDNEESENDNGESDTASTSSTSDSDYLLRGSEREILGIRKRGRPNNSVKVSDDEIWGATTSDDKSTCSPLLYVQKNRDFAHHWAEPGTTCRKTYVSKRRPVTCAEKERVLEAAKACPITHSSYLRQLEKDNVYRALVLAIPAPWWRENMPQTKHSYKAILVDEEGNSWQTRIGGAVIFWNNFSLDHYLEEDDVVVMELVDFRLKSLKFLVHIFRVVDVRMTVTGKAGWAIHYTIIDGIKKKEARRQLLKAQGKLENSSASGRRLRRRSAPNLENPRYGRVTKTPNKRLTRLRAALQRSEEISASATHRTVDSEHDSEDALPLKHSRNTNSGGPTPSRTDSCRSDGGLGSSAGTGASIEQKAEEKSGKQCVVCWDAPAEAVCIPCGHLAGCMDCLTAIKCEDWGCPICRASIQQVVKIYAV